MLLGGLANVSVLGCGARDLGGDGIGCIPWAGDDALGTLIADCVVEGVGLIFLDQVSLSSSIGCPGCAVHQPVDAADGPSCHRVCCWHSYRDAQSHSGHALCWNHGRLVSHLASCDLDQSTGLVFHDLVDAAVGMRA